MQECVLLLSAVTSTYVVDSAAPSILLVRLFGVLIIVGNPTGARYLLTVAAARAAHLYGAALHLFVSCRAQHCSSSGSTKWEWDQKQFCVRGSSAMVT